jgi:hypothetical protein
VYPFKPRHRTQGIEWLINAKVSPKAMHASVALFAICNKNRYFLRIVGSDWVVQTCPSKARRLPGFSCPAIPHDRGRTRHIFPLHGSCTAYPTVPWRYSTTDVSTSRMKDSIVYRCALRTLVLTLLCGQGCHQNPTLCTNKLEGFLKICEGFLS